MKLFVTGGAGFIGSNFIRYWLARHPQDQVVNFDALTYAGNPASLADIAGNPNYTFIQGDIRDKTAVEQAMGIGEAGGAVADGGAGIDIIVHFAAESHVDRSILGPADFVTTNILGTQVLLDAARLAKVKHFHHVSTDEVFGSLALDEKRIFNEESNLRPNSPYSASKAGSDLLARAYHKTYGLPVTISNTSNNYGPYQSPEKLIPLMTIKALRGEPLPVYGDGLNVRDWIYVEDHCRAIELILDKGTPGETYCVGGDNEIANIDIIKKILHILGKDESLISYVPDRPGHDRRYAVDSSKIARELGFTLAFDFDKGLQQTVEWYRDHQDWWQPLIESDQYKKFFDQNYQKR